MGLTLALTLALTPALTLVHTTAPGLSLALSLALTLAHTPALTLVHTLALTLRRSATVWRCGCGKRTTASTRASRPSPTAPSMSFSRRAVACGVYLTAQMHSHTSHVHVHFIPRMCMHVQHVTPHTSHFTFHLVRVRVSTSHLREIATVTGVDCYIDRLRLLR